MRMVFESSSFTKFATDLEPYHEEWHSRESDPEVCDHSPLPPSFHPENTCATC